MNGYGLNFHLRNIITVYFLKVPENPNIQQFYISNALNKLIP